MQEANYQRRMRQKLTDVFAPIHMEIIDDSTRHKGHAGHDPRGETHFKLRIVSAAFAGLSRVARHRLIYDALSEEMQERVHALNIEALAPEEYNYR
jgi:BolA family transcriptional regulator, general stress-responsive regulator